MNDKITNMFYKFIPETTITVPAERIAYTLCAAIEGGSTYWCSRIDVSGMRGMEYAFEAMARGAECTVYPHGDEPEHIKDTDCRILDALKIMHKDYPKHYEDMVNENEDADTGDCLLQLITFGEVIYG